MLPVVFGEIVNSLAETFAPSRCGRQPLNRRYFEGLPRFFSLDEGRPPVVDDVTRLQVAVVSNIDGMICGADAVAAKLDLGARRAVRQATSPMARCSLLLETASCAQGRTLPGRTIAEVHRSRRRKPWLDHASD